MRHQLLRAIGQCLVGRWSFQQLEMWLVGHLQAIFDSGDEPAIEIANELDCDFIEFGEGLVTQRELQSRLDAYLSRGSTIRASYPEEQQFTRFTTATASETLETVPVLSFAHR